jgi:hypothetical protein
MERLNNQIDHILIDRRRQSSVLDVRLFRGAHTDPDHSVVVAKVRERLAVSKWNSAQISYGEVQSQEIKQDREYWVKISDRFTALENLDDDVNVNRAWETNIGNIKISARESRLLSTEATV